MRHAGLAIRRAQRAACDIRPACTVQCRWTRCISACRSGVVPSARCACGRPSTARTGAAYQRPSGARCGGELENQRRAGPASTIGPVRRAASSPPLRQHGPAPRDSRREPRRSRRRSPGRARDLRDRRRRRPRPRPRRLTPRAPGRPRVPTTVPSGNPGPSSVTATLIPAAALPAVTRTREPPCSIALAIRFPVACASRTGSPSSGAHRVSPENSSVTPRAPAAGRQASTDSRATRGHVHLGHGPSPAGGRASPARDQRAHARPGPALSGARGAASHQAVIAQRRARRRAPRRRAARAARARRGPPPVASAAGAGARRPPPAAASAAASQPAADMVIPPPARRSIGTRHPRR